MNGSNPRRRFPALASALAGLLLGGAARAAAPAAEPPQAATTRPAPNAALQYWQAFAVLPAMDDGQRAIAENVAVAKLDPAAVRLIEAGTNSLRQLHRGAAIRACDWGLNEEDGMLLLLPHLAKARDLARLACLRARLAFDRGDEAAAFEDLADALAVARHGGAGSTLIAILVQDAIEQTVVTVAAPHLAGAKGPAARRFGDRLAGLPAGGSLKESAVRIETRMGLEWLIDKLKNAKPNEDWKALFAGMTAEAGPGGDDLSKSAGEDRAGVIRRLEATRPYYEQMPAVLDLPPDEFRIRAAALYKRYAQDPWAKMMLPDYTKVYDKHLAAETRLTMLRAAAAVGAGGPGAAQGFRDPAGGGPFEFVFAADGYELRSKVTIDGKPVTLRVGPVGP